MRKLAKTATRLKRRYPAANSDLPGSRYTNLPALWLMTDAARLPAPQKAIAALPQDAGVIFRHYTLADRAALGAELRALCARRRLPFLVAGDLRLALALRADGVHLPEMQARQAGAIKRRAPQLWVTVAAHSLPALRRAQAAGADAALLSPIFPTQSHPGGAIIGPHRFARLVGAIALPVYALGGVNEENAARLNASGAFGIAAISALEP